MSSRRDQGHAAGLVEVGGHETAPRREARHDRGARRRSVSKSSIDSSMPISQAIASRWSTPLVEPPLAATPAMAFSIASRVMICEGRTSSRTSRITSSPAATAAASLSGCSGRDAVEPRRADAQQVEGHRHGVGGELAAAGAGAGAGDALEGVDLLRPHLAGRVGADHLEDVLDGHVAAPVAARRDRAVVEDEPGDVEARQRHRGRRDRLVAADQAHEPVEEVAARGQLDRVGDHLARHQRAAHALGAHRHAVGDRDRVQLHRRAARGAHAALHVLRPGRAG